MSNLLAQMKWWRKVVQLWLFLVVAFGASAFAAWNGTLEASWVLLAAVSGVGVLVWQYADFRVGKLLQLSILHAQFQAYQAFDALYGRSPVAYVLIDEKGGIHLTNTAAVNLLDATLDSISTYNFYNFIADSEDITTSVLQTKIEKGVTITEAEMPLKTATKETKWVSISVFQPNDPSQRLIALADITDKKAVDTAKSEFVALATHQLRTPIAAIRWNVELLSKSLRGSTTEKQARYLVKVERNVHRMLHLINDFLSVSKLEMGTYTAAPEEVVLEEYLDEILQEFDEKISQKQLQLQKHADPGHIVISVDSRLMHIVFSNLISNAVKYTPDGGTVKMEAVATGGSLTLTIADSGIGIPEEELPKLFTKFYRASNAQQQVTEGTGLGLYVVKQSVEILGGSITVDSQQDKGTTFVVQLPSVVVSGR